MSPADRKFNRIAHPPEPMSPRHYTINIVKLLFLILWLLLTSPLPERLPPVEQIRQEDEVEHQVVVVEALAHAVPVS